MKRILGLLMCLVLLAGAALPAAAQTSRRGYSSARAERTERRDNSRRAYYNYQGRDDDRSVWEKHRDKLTVAGGAGAGALIGALVGGKKGAIIGALAGAGGSALYTYKLRDRNDGRRYYRRR